MPADFDLFEEVSVPNILEMFSTFPHENLQHFTLTLVQRIFPVEAGTDLPICTILIHILDYLTALNKYQLLLVPSEIKYYVH
jgi:hypothetical protein